MIPTTITDSDMICLQSVESFLKERNIPLSQSPQERIMVTQQARDWLYSEIARRFTRVAGYILQADLETDDMAKGLNYSLSKHLLDPVFVNILMCYLARENQAEANTLTGAYLCRVLNKWMEQNPMPKADAKGKKDSEPTTVVTEEEYLAPVKHLNDAVFTLLGKMADIIAVKSVGLSKNQCVAIAACLAMNNDATIHEIINSDFPITADVFDVYTNPSNIIKSILLLKKDELPTKPTINQSAFIDSLKRWVYNMLNKIPTQSIFPFLVSTYGGMTTVDVSDKFINPKSCGNQYSNLLTVAKQIIN